MFLQPVWGAEKPAPSASQSAAETQSPVRYTSVQTLPYQVTLATLSNGLTVIVQENHVAPVATVRCFVKNTGSAFESQWLGAGLSHVLEHVVAGGTTTHRTEDEIRKIVQTFGGATNAFTSTDMTAFFIDCPAKNVSGAIDLVADSMQHVKFEPKEFDRELKVVRRELADGEVDRGRVLHQMLSQTLYAVSPARHPIIGYLDVLNKTRNHTIIDFYRRRYVPENQVFVVVGDVKTQAVLDDVLGQWANTRRGYETAVVMPEEPEQLAPREAVREMEGATCDMAIAWPTVELSHKDLYALDLAAYILGEGESSRLVRHLKYDQQLVLSVSALSDTPHYVRGWFGVLAVTQPKNWKQAAEAIVAEVYRLRDELVDPAELARAKKQKAAELVLQQQTVQQAADSLGRSFISAADPLFERHYVEEIQKVTAEQIREVARRWFVPERLNRAIVAPPGVVPRGAEQKIAEAQSEVQLKRLPNGLRVLIKRHPNLPLVNMQAFVVGGLLVDSPETAGRSALVAEMLERGTAKHTAQQIAEYFDSIGGQFGASSGRNTVYASATVLREDFAPAFDLFAECFTQPAFPDDEFQKVKQLALGAIARRADNPHQQCMEFFFDNLPPESPYHLLEGGKKQTVERLTIADLRSYHKQYFVPENMIVAVFGDVDPDTALKLVEKRFGALEPAPAFKAIGFRRPNAVADSVVRHLQIAKPTGMVVMGYPEVCVFDRKEHAALTVLNAVLAGYIYPGGWLHEELRGEGLVYWVQAMQLTGPAPGFFVIAAQTHPEKVTEVIGRIQKNLERAKQGKIDPEEFGTCKQMVIALHSQQSTTIASQAQLAALNELYGLGYDFDSQFDESIQAVTLDEVVAVAKKYLTNHVLVTASPNGGK
jgi:zinc protease